MQCIMGRLLLLESTSGCSASWPNSAWASGWQMPPCLVRDPDAVHHHLTWHGVWYILLLGVEYALHHDLTWHEPKGGRHLPVWSGLRDAMHRNLKRFFDVYATGCRKLLGTPSYCTYNLELVIRMQCTKGFRSEFLN
ncbi:uncharacterized protein LOC108095513 [Drosophila ficusphila]|uniref:uncharacterized protein LOC108095513 n=1 Tax=Drosophila ficusphila TaxID=30025 RepID=UPI0007E829FD|nr:uncharacterized protein LOC108095513 [Drosophila ficusphila]